MQSMIQRQISDKKCVKFPQRERNGEQFEVQNPKVGGGGGERADFGENLMKCPVIVVYNFP